MVDSQMEGAGDSSSLASLYKDFERGDTLSVGEAARLPPGYGKRGITVATIYRWCKIGAKSKGGVVIKLETALIGGRLVTSKAAMTRFIAALNKD